MSEDNFSDTNNKPSHNAYTVKPGRNNQNYWSKIGAAWPAKDDGFTVKLDATPLDGIVHVRSIEHLEKMRAERKTHNQTQTHNQDQEHGH